MLFKKIGLFVLLIVITTSTNYGQNTFLGSTYKDSVVQLVSDLLMDNYVFPDKAEQTAVYLQKLNEQGHFVKALDLEGFADLLTNAIFDITKDKHLSVNLKKDNPNISEETDPLMAWVEERLKSRHYLRQSNAKFKTVEKKEGNIGYLDLRGFYGLDKGRKYADLAMAMLSTSDAIIIDLRYNSGGRGDMVAYLLAYFFEEPIIGSQRLRRRGNEFIEHIDMTPEFVNGIKMPDVPLYILTSHKTFSAAEGFCYPLQIYKRATFVGEITKGGANPGKLISINKDLEIFISDVSVTHPLTGSSWEGVGIQPDIEVTSEEALAVALEQAQKAAEEFRIRKVAVAREYLLNLEQAVTNFSKDSPNELIINAYLACREYDLIFEEWELNAFGYQLLDENAYAAEAVLETNTILYPDSPNTYDSYAEVLAQNGKSEEALENYEKAVATAQKYQDERLKIFKENLENFKKQ